MLHNQAVKMHLNDHMLYMYAIGLYLSNTIPAKWAELKIGNAAAFRKERQAEMSEKNPSRIERTEKEK